MPKLIQINAACNMGSTGRIMEQIGLLAKKNGWDSYIAHGHRYVAKSELKDISTGSIFDDYRNIAHSLITGKHGEGSKHTTQELIKRIDDIKPDIIHLHNIHGYYINYPILFDYLNKSSIPVVWTLHDCWTITGHCAHFVTAGCEKWKSGCNDCPLIKTYPKSLFFDRSKKNYEKKRYYFGQKKNLHVVVPSNWLKDIVKKSFLKDKSIEVINNGIDLNVFKYTGSKTIDVRKKRILGVSGVWNEDKGFNDFLLLRKQLPVEEYDIILVGLNKKQIRTLPKDIIGIERTNSVYELAELYSQADVYVNVSHADTFPTTNLESLACGTPVVTYRTGGSPEAIDENTGIVVEKGDIDGIKNAIISICNKGKDFYKVACRKRAMENFNKDDRFADYIKLYEKIIG